MPITILYHAQCPDGIAAAFACWQRFRDEAVYVPVSYGQPPPIIPEDHNVYIVDFSYPEETLKALLAVRIGHRKHDEYVVTVIDHHASAQRDLASLQAQELPGLSINFAMEESGASLTWKYLKNPRNYNPITMEQDLPPFFAYVRDRDLWQWYLPDSKAVSLAYRLVQHEFLATGDFQRIAHFAEDLETAQGLYRIITEGTALERYAAVLVEEQAARAVEGVIGGYMVPIVNATTLFSEVGDYLCTTRLEIPFCAYYFDRDDKRQWGLRGRGKVDLSVIAKAYGGGGHYNASGFITARGWFPD